MFSDDSDLGPPYSLWSNGIGTESIDEAVSVAVAPGGDLVVLGKYYDPYNVWPCAVPNPYGYYDYRTCTESPNVFLARYSAAGDERWIRRWSDPDNSAWPAEVVVAPDGSIIVAGTFWGTVTFGGRVLESQAAGAFLVKLTADGSHVWSVARGGGDVEWSRSLAATEDGGAVLAGTVTGLAGYGSSDSFLARYSSDGELLWEGLWGNSERDEYIEAVSVSPAGSILAVGSFNSTFSLGGDPVATAGRLDAFLASYSAEGGHLWSRQLGGDGDDRAYDIAIDQSGAFAVSGYFTTRLRIDGTVLEASGWRGKFLARFSQLGELVWARVLEQPEDLPVPTRLSFDSAGDLVVAGYVAGTDADHDIAIAKHHGSDGSPIWWTRFESEGHDHALGVATNEENEVVVTGSFQGKVAFGAAPLRSGGRRAALADQGCVRPCKYEDAFLAKFAP
jgi:hypothetical protein